MSDEEIMARYAQGDQHSFSEIFARWAPRLHGYFLRVTGVSGDADDLLQATFLKVHRGRRSFRPELGLRGWLFTIAIRVRKDEARRRSRHPSAAGTLDVEALEAPEEGDRAVAQERASAVRAALARLPDSQREVIYLHQFEQMTFAEIAKVLGTSEGAVRQRAFRVYEKLREELAPLLEEEQVA